MTNTSRNYTLLTNQGFYVTIVVHSSLIITYGHIDHGAIWCQNYETISQLAAGGNRNPVHVGMIPNDYSKTYIKT